MNDKCINTTVCGDRKTFFVCFTGSCRENGVLIVIVIVNMFCLQTSEGYMLTEYSYDIKFNKRLIHEMNKVFYCFDKKNQFNQKNCFLTEQSTKLYVYILLLHHIISSQDRCNFFDFISLTEYRAWTLFHRMNQQNVSN